MIATRSLLVLAMSSIGVAACSSSTAEPAGAAVVADAGAETSVGPDTTIVGSCSMALGGTMYACTQWSQAIAAGAAAAFCPANAGVTVSTSASPCAAPGAGGGTCTFSFAASGASYLRVTVLYPSYPGGMAGQKAACEATATAEATAVWTDG